MYFDFEEAKCPQGMDVSSQQYIDPCVCDLAAWEVGGNKRCKILAGNLGMEAPAKTSPPGAVACGTLPLWSMCM